MTGDYIFWFVALSYAVAVFGSYSAILLSDRMLASAVWFQRNLYHIVGSIALGTGIWTMHYIGMFAYHVNIFMTYDISLTILSLFFAIFFSYTAIGFVRHKMRPRDYIFGAILAGTAVTAMHYIGISAMKMDARLAFHPIIFGLSYVIAIAASGAVLWIITALAQLTGSYKKALQFGAACIMGVAVCGMHYTGMAAMVIIPNERCLLITNTDNNFFASIILFVGLSVIWGTMFIAVRSEKLRTTQEFQKRTSLKSQIILFFILFLFLMISSIWFISNITSKRTIAYWVETQRRTVAETILSHLQRDTSRIEVLAFSLAEYMERADFQNAATIKRDIPPILDYPDLINLVAGGGIWPEPYSVGSQKDRNSFFWGRDQKGRLHFSDYYNRPDSPPYYYEEWYVPVRYIPVDTCYWSRSYIDSYSREPIITCSQGVYHDDKDYIGVVTVDMRIKYLWDILKKSSEKINGYALLFDRNNRLIATQTDPNHGKNDFLFMTLKEFSDKNPWFSPVQTRLDQINAVLRGNVEKNKKYTNIAADIKRKVKSLQQEDALNIAAILDDINMPNDIGTADAEIEKLASEPLFIKNDMFLNGPTDANIFVDQTNHWKLVVATPQDLIDIETQKILLPVILATIVTASIALAGFYAAIQFMLIFPLNRIVSKLEDQQKNGISDNNKLYNGATDELGLIKYLFDKQNHELTTAVEIATRSNHEKSLFLANMSHELRTPLNGILGLLQLVDPKRIPPDIAEINTLMAKSGQNLLEIVNDILDLSKIEADGVELERLAFDVHAKTHEAVQILLPMASKKGLSLSFASSGNPIYVMGDPLRVSRIITNLVSNAIRYTDQGSVTVSIDSSELSASNVLVEIKVRDTGIGIPPDKHAVIFEKFVQGDNSTTRRFGGTGLGLSITKELVELMSGSIGLESEVGKGSEFWVRIPFDKASAEDIQHRTDKALAETEKASSPAHALAPDRVRILVAEDHLMNQAFIKRLFENLGIKNFKIVSNGRYALDEVKTGRYDLVLMDCHMPEIDGYDATAAIRNLPDPILNRIPIIAMTANAMTGDEEKCIDAGMNAYISKPISIAVFKHKLSPWVNFSGQKEGTFS